MMRILIAGILSSLAAIFLLPVLFKAGTWLRQMWNKLAGPDK